VGIRRDEPQLSRAPRLDAELAAPGMRITVTFRPLRDGKPAACS
jgi:hypothetical protein